jgi:hypothetical protein
MAIRSRLEINPILHRLPQLEVVALKGLKATMVGKVLTVETLISVRGRSMALFE